MGTFYEYNHKTMEIELAKYGANIVQTAADVAVVGSSCAGDPSSLKAKNTRLSLSAHKIVTQEWVTQSMKV